MGIRFGTKRSADVTIRRVHDGDHLIADDVAIPLSEADKADTEKAIAVLGRLRDRAIEEMKAADVELANEEEDHVVTSFEFRIEGSKAVVQVAQVAE